MEIMAVKKGTYRFWLIGSIVMIVLSVALLIWLFSTLIYRCKNVSRLEKLTYSSLNIVSGKEYQMAGESYQDLICRMSPNTTNTFKLCRYQGQDTFYAEKISKHGIECHVYYCYSSKVTYIGDVVIKIGLSLFILFTFSCTLRAMILSSNRFVTV